MYSNENISKELDLTCPKCGNDNSNIAKFCDKCGEQLVYNVNPTLNENEYSDERVIGKIYMAKFITSIVEVQYGSLVFTTDRVLVVETAYNNSPIAYKAKKTSEKIHKKLSKMTPDEIFSSEWPCQSIPYSQIERIKVRKGFLTNLGEVKIVTGENNYKYTIQPMRFELRRDFKFLKELKPILGDKLKVKR
ncbi:zinc ribbon domain-containing protein [Methanobacterium oryzae]|uniref:zinc ribbon domain-containing protein n=1 Tax=Methanobacterium oryzae TaxID=69540 RepID=UPI003D195F19